MMNNTDVILPKELELKNLTLDDILNISENVWKYQSEWWYKAAYDSITENRYEIIKGRNDDYVYLVRMWLTIPQTNKDGRGFESSNDAMIHWFARPDDDAALHDHPWDFKTTILCGEYDEYLPTLDWLSGDKILGSKWDSLYKTKVAGDTASRLATDLHCIGRVKRGTMTLMRTGPRKRLWGFHAEGEIWRPFYEYLDLNKERNILNIIK